MIKPRLQKFYINVVCEDFVVVYNFKNIAYTTSFECLMVNSTSSHFKSFSHRVLQCFGAWLLETSQKSVQTKAKKSIALFDIRKDSLLGLKATIRKSACFMCLDKLLIWVLPFLQVRNSVQFDANDFCRDDGIVENSILFEQALSGHNLSTIQQFALSKRARVLFFCNEKKNTASQTRLAELEKQSSRQYIGKKALYQASPAKQFVVSPSLTRRFAQGLPLRENRLLYANPTCERYELSVPDFDFTISHSSARFFPEIADCSLLFDGVSGFSFSCWLTNNYKRQFVRAERCMLPNLFTVKKQLASAFKLPLFF